MKKIVLIAQERSAFLHVAPLATVFRKNGVFEPVLVRVLADADRAEHNALCTAFGLSDAVRAIPAESGSPVGETAAFMLEFERLFGELSPDFVVPGGHDNASLAGALAAAKMTIPVVSLDAGLRSYDRAESREINRLVIDSVAALHFVSEHSGIYNLMNEGVADEQILFAGNTAIDSLVTLIGHQADASGVLKAHGLEPKKFVIALLDLPVSSGSVERRELIGKLLESLAATATVILPVGPSPAAELLEAFDAVPGLRLIATPGYIDLLQLFKASALVLTDSAEFEAELTVMNVPCLTMRQSTARPSTIEIGTNVLVGNNELEILERASIILSGKESKKTLIPEKWDGAAAKRVAEMLERAE
ncbi:MAG TPA: UDP-N-acetyl glucosamine 2-epimerase [Chlorobaculum parvum]|uniref:UDP-N-acetyl glucosamine 2-epimerase n=1 Tax=Chlorobaculum parvum TaxID=274539 RepID=A0A7C5DBR7_9CHLB|nr:UDP-N-acetyl glucosamine 2-epimerase [Chlorobaculum parvum]